MMGKKERHFAPLINVSIEELVPRDHFYRHRERTLDLSFVRELVGKLGETSTDFEVKPRKSARNRGIAHSEPGETASHLASSINIL
jgi:hypothetical protein